MTNVLPERKITVRNEVERFRYVLVPLDTVKLSGWAGTLWSERLGFGRFVRNILKRPNEWTKVLPEREVTVRNEVERIGDELIPLDTVKWSEWADTI